MKIFLSWSGLISRDVAALLRRWFPSIIQATKPWMSDEDIAPGSLWFGAISKEIEASKYGVICVTKQNQSAPWLLWEAGALYRGFEDTQLVVPLLIDVDKSELGPPLSHFQVVDASDKRDVVRMLSGINRNLADPISDEILTAQVNFYWKELQEGIAQAIKDHPVVKNPATGNVRIFKEAADRYLSELRGGKSYTRTEQALERVSSYLNHLPLNEIDNSALAQYKKDRVAGNLPLSKEGRKIKPAMIGTVNKELRVVSTILHRAVDDWRWMDFSPTIRLMSGQTKQRYVLSWEEQDRVFACLPEYARPGALFAVNTGLKRSEIRELRWNQEQRLEKRETSFFVVPIGQKYNKIVVLNSIAKNVIEGQRGKNEEFVFTNRKGQQDKNFGTKTWIRAWAKAGLSSDEMTLKGVENLRHTFGVRLRAAGVAQEDIDMLMGSTTAHIQQRYSHPDISNLIDCVEKIVDREKVDYTPIRPG